MDLQLTSEECSAIVTSIKGIQYLFGLSENNQENWLLWLDFLLEVQSILVKNGAEHWKDHFPFRMGNNIYSLGHMFTDFAHGKINSKDLDTVLAKLLTNNENRD